MRSALAAGSTSCALALVGCEKKHLRHRRPRPPPRAAPRPRPPPGERPASPATPSSSARWARSPAREATFGISTRNGIELAIKEANAAGGVKGKKLAVRVYDDQGKPEEAANAATRLITQDNVMLILGEVASHQLLAMAHKAQAAKVPMITPSSTNPKVTAEVGDYIFRVCFIDPFQGYVMAKFARENLKLTKVAVLKDNKSAYSLGLTEVFSRKFTEMGGKIVADREPTPRATPTSARSSPPSSRPSRRPSTSRATTTTSGIIARQARELGIKVPLLGGDGWDSDKLFELGGSAVEGSYFSNHYSPDDPNPRGAEVHRRLQGRPTARCPTALAALGYDAARVAIDAMKRAPDFDRAGASATPSPQTKDFPGVAGTITLDENRNAVKPAVVLEGRATARPSTSPPSSPRCRTSSSTSSTASPPAPSTRSSRSATRWCTAC